MGRPFIILDAKDNVATALKDLEKGFEIKDSMIEGVIDCLEDIPNGHKVAIKPIKENEDAIKYGVTIGRITRDIKAGELVHVSNLVSKRGKERVND